MKTFLIGYIIIINFGGFLLMGIDKWKARTGRWRIAEKTLFIVALLGGSIGSIVGMYFFRHKTKHLSFTIGLPTILVLQLLAVILIFIFHQERLESPSSAVNRELELIQNLDETTIQNFISYESLMSAPAASADVGPETTEAVDLFFKNFDYHIHSENITDDTAVVSVEIINIDTRSLARDLCRSLTAANINISQDQSGPYSLNDYFSLLRNTLSENTYDLTATTAYFNLVRENNIWVIQSDDTLENELVSGFISWINDPMLLTPQEVLTFYLEEFSSLTAQDWVNYLDIQDIFSTYSEKYYAAVDSAYMEKIAEFFDYEIKDCTIDGTSAGADISITSVDMTHVLDVYKSSLLLYAHSTEPLRSDNEQQSDASAQYLLQALQEDAVPASYDVTVTLINDGNAWQLDIDDSLTNAFLGDITSAMETFRAS